MSRIFQNQSAGRIVANTQIDFTIYNPTELKIKYTKPDGTAGEWVANILAESEEQGKIYVDFSPTVLFDMAGTWVLWAYVVFNDGRAAPGAKFRYVVAVEGN